MHQNKKGLAIVVAWAAIVSTFLAFFGFILYSEAPENRMPRDPVIGKTRILSVENGTPSAYKLLCFEASIKGEGYVFVAKGSNKDVAALSQALSDPNIIPRIEKNGPTTSLVYILKTPEGEVKIIANSALDEKGVVMRP